MLGAVCPTHTGARLGFESKSSSAPIALTGYSRPELSSEVSDHPATNVGQSEGLSRTYPLKSTQCQHLISTDWRREWDSNSFTTLCQTGILLQSWRTTPPSTPLLVLARSQRALPGEAVAQRASRQLVCRLRRQGMAWSAASPASVRSCRSHRCHASSIIYRRTSGAAGCRRRAALIRAWASTGNLSDQPYRVGSSSFVTPMDLSRRSRGLNGREHLKNAIAMLRACRHEP